MRAGILTREIIEIFSVEVSRNIVGEQIQKYNKIYRCRCQVTHDGGGKRTENDEVVTLYDKVFVVRSYVPVKENYIIFWRGKKFRILDIDIDLVNQSKTIKAEQINE